MTYLSLTKMKRFAPSDDLAGLVSKINSPSLSLLSTESFTGSWEDVSEYASVSILIIIDTGSSEAGTLTMHLSTDAAGTNTRTKSVLVSTGTSSVHTLSLVSRYFRISFAADQGTACNGVIQTIYNKYRAQGLISFVGETINDQNDASLVRSVITAKNTKGDYVNVSADLNGGLKISNGLVGIYGESIGITYTPYVQTSHFYGIASQDQLHTTFKNGGGAVTSTSDGTSIDISIGATPYDYAMIRDARVIKYRHGFGNIVRVGAIFDGNAVADSLQFIGVGNALSDLYFCYSGSTFGVRSSTGGRLHVVKLTVSVAANSTQSVTVRLNSVDFTFNVTNAGGDLVFNAHEIEVGATFTGWNTEHAGNDIFFIAGSVGSRGADLTNYSFTNNSGGSCDASFTLVTEGAFLTTAFVAQSAWNGASGMVTALDPTQINLYEIQYTWFGNANIIFKVYNNVTGKFETVHTLSYANLGTDISLTSGNMYIQRGVASLSLASTTALSLMSTGSFGATLGTYNILKQPRATIVNTEAIAANTEEVVLVIHTLRIINGYTNNSEGVLIQVSIAIDGNRPVGIKLIKNPTLAPTATTSDYTSLEYVNEGKNIVAYDTLSRTYDTSTGQVLNQFIIPKNGGITLDLSTLEFFISPGDNIAITALSSATNTIDVSVVVVSDN